MFVFRDSGHHILENRLLERNELDGLRFSARKQVGVCRVTRDKGIPLCMQFLMKCGAFGAKHARVRLMEGEMGRLLLWLSRGVDENGLRFSFAVVVVPPLNFLDTIC